MTGVTVKKAYEEIVGFLHANKDKKVNTIFEEVVKMCQAKGKGGVATASHSVDGQVVAIRCNQFKLWFPLSHVDFGAKAGSATGFNSMCKLGANLFSSGQRKAKLAKEALLGDVASGKVEAADVAAALKTIEAARVEVPVYPVEGMGWTELEDLLALSPEDLDALIPEPEPEPEETEDETED